MICFASSALSRWCAWPSHVFLAASCEPNSPLPGSMKYSWLAAWIKTEPEWRSGPYITDLTPYVESGLTILIWRCTCQTSANSLAIAECIARSLNESTALWRCDWQTWIKLETHLSKLTLQSGPGGFEGHSENTTIMNAACHSGVTSVDGAAHCRSRSIDEAG